MTPVVQVDNPVADITGASPEDIFRSGLSNTIYMNGMIMQVHQAHKNEQEVSEELESEQVIILRRKRIHKIIKRHSWNVLNSIPSSQNETERKSESEATCLRMGKTNDETTKPITAYAYL